jgi:hypothetical protein
VICSTSTSYIQIPCIVYKENQKGVVYTVSIEGEAATKLELDQSETSTGLGDRVLDSSFSIAIEPLPTQYQLNTNSIPTSSTSTSTMEMTTPLQDSTLSASGVECGTDLDLARAISVRSLRRRA